MSFHDFIERAWAYGIKPKSRRKITAQQMYPWAVERQLQADLKAEFTKAGLFYKEQALKGTQSLKDNADDLLAAEFNNDERLRPLAERVAYEVEKFQQACFENFSDVVIGERYIPSVVGPSVTETWENNFLTLCRSTNDDMKRRVSAIISDAVMNGNNIADTARQIDEAVSSYSYSKALTIARTETGKLNMAISKAQMEEAGIDKYEWSCMMDERSRPSHEKMDGKICIWSNPNVVYNIKTKKTEPRPQSAVHLHPGDDYNCRCVALPWDELIEEELNQKKGKPNKQWLELKEQEKQKAAEKRAEREEIKRNKELVPKLEKQVESQKNKIDKLQQQLLEEKLENEALQETLELNGVEGEPHEEILHIHSDTGVTKIKITARSRQEAKYFAYLEIKNNPGKYGPNAIVPKFDPSKYESNKKQTAYISEPAKKVNTVQKPTETKPTSKKNETEIKPSNKKSTETVKIPNDILSISQKIKQGKIDEQWLNENLFNGYRILSDISVINKLPDGTRELVLLELKNNPSKYASRNALEQLINEKLNGPSVKIQKTAPTANNEINTETKNETKSFSKSNAENLKKVSDILGCNKLDGPQDVLTMPYKDVNKGFSATNPATNCNCASCSISTVLRYRGLDVEAIEKPHFTKTATELQKQKYYEISAYHPSTHSKVATGFKDINGNRITTVPSTSQTTTPNSIDSQIKKFKELTKRDGMYVLGTAWKSGGGHAFNYYVKNGVGKIIDKQAPGRDGESLASFFKNVRLDVGITVLYTEDLLIDLDYVKYITRKSSKK